MILPVILSGGAGSRLWPLSTPAHPKQLLPLLGERTMIQATASRFEGAGFAPPAVICNAAHAAEVVTQLPDGGAILLEPMGRNTAPAAAAAALHGRETGAELVLLAPADHHIADVESFRKAVTQAAPVAREGHIVTFGIAPTRPETGYGYILMAEGLSVDVRRVDAFVEKPDRETAEGYIASGDYAWNAGLFLFSPVAMIGELSANAPDILSSVEKAMAAAKRDGRILSLDAKSFGDCRAESIDYAVMETTNRAACLSVEMGWSDIGSFAALHEARERDSDDNALAKGTRSVGSSNCLVETDGPRVNLVGVEGLGVIIRDGEVLVVNLADSQDVKHL